MTEIGIHDCGGQQFPGDAERARGNGWVTRLALGIKEIRETAMIQPNCRKRWSRQAKERTGDSNMNWDV
jgi:hypothetical protein